MSVVSYGGINLGLVKTSYIHEEVVRDASSGVDSEMIHGTFEFLTILNSYAVATNVGIAPNFPGQGDTAGITLNNLRSILSTDRLQLIVSVSPARVISTPGFFTPTFGPQANMPVGLDCDVKNGPHVIDWKVTQVEGDKTFIIYFKVESWYPGTTMSNVLLSNRWSMVQDTGFDGLTTRITHGQATIRADVIRLNSFIPNDNFGTPQTIKSADNFRAALFLPIPFNFVRKNIRTTLSPDGTNLDYVLTDQETGLTLGPNSPAIMMQGNFTSGMDTPIKDVRSGVAAAFAIWKGAVASFNLFSAIETLVKTFIPIAKCAGICRVYGNKTTPKQSLVNMALSVLIDRSSVGGNLSLPVSTYITQGLDSDRGPYMEARMEFFPTFQVQLGAILNPLDVNKTQNLTNDIAGSAKLPLAGPILANNATAVNPSIGPSQPTNGVINQVAVPNPVANVRGTYFDVMVAQAFTPFGSFVTPPPIPAPGPNLASAF